ncbi:MAG: hypothetical protein ACFFCS_21905 [Candidatus Hodarchaeota archaeon]
MPTCTDCKRSISGKDFSTVLELCYGCAQKRKKVMKLAFMLSGLFLSILPILVSINAVFNSDPIEPHWFYWLVGGGVLILISKPFSSFLMKKGFKPDASASNTQATEPVDLDDEKSRRIAAFVLSLVGIAGLLIFEPVTRKFALPSLLTVLPVEIALDMLSTIRARVLSLVVMVSPCVLYMGWGAFLHGAKAMKKTRDGSLCIFFFSVIGLGYLCTFVIGIFLTIGIYNPAFVFITILLGFGMLILIGGIIGNRVA